jgi:hypothetical protein
VRRLRPLALLLLAAASCGPRRSQSIAPAEPRPIPGKAAPRASIPPIEIKEVFPREAESGVFFDLDFDGSSAVYVAGDGFSPRSVVLFEGRPVATEYQVRRRLIARIPPNLLARPRTVQIEVMDPGPPPRRSSPAEFRILPPRSAGACPRAESISPASTRAGVAFGQQPDGSSAIRVLGADFGPRTVVEFHGEALKTVYHGPAALVALIPPDLLNRAGTATVTLIDPDCRRSDAPHLKFEILP